MGRWFAGLVAAVVMVAPATVAVATPATAGDNSAVRQSLDALIKAGVTGAIARVDDGRRVRTVARGDAVLDPRTPIDAGGGFRVASITKSFVATIILQLVGERRMRLSDSVEQWLPGVVPGGANITVRQLLNHTSGVFNYTEDQAWRTAFLANPTREWSARELVTLATAHPPLFPPGGGWSYSNTNYLIAGLIAEAATGRPLPRLINERITRPLQLRDTFLATNAQVRPGHVHGYQPPSVTGGGYVDTTTWNPTAAGAAGAVVSTASDLARFYSALLSGRLLLPAQQREMLTTVYVEQRNGGYGLGIYYLNTPCGTVWGHSGGFPGYNSIAYQDKSGRRSVVLLVATELDQTTAPLFNRAVEMAVCQMFGAEHVSADVAAFGGGTVGFVRE